MGEKGNLAEHAASAAGEHGESGGELGAGLAAKATGELAAGMVVGAAGEKLEERAKRRREAAGEGGAEPDTGADSTG